jgi:hypothetical protein
LRGDGRPSIPLDKERGVPRGIAASEQSVAVELDFMRPAPVGGLTQTKKAWLYEVDRRSARATLRREVDLEPLLIFSDQLLPRALPRGFLPDP